MCSEAWANLICFWGTWLWNAELQSRVSMLGWLRNPLPGAVPLANGSKGWLVALRGAFMVPQECVCSGTPALCSSGCVQCRALEKINEEGDVYYHEKLEFILKKKDHGIFPWEVSHDVQSQQEGNEKPGCKKELNWKYTKKVPQNPYTERVTMFL